MKFRIIRRLPDGRSEIQDERGSVRRCSLYECSQCSQLLPQDDLWTVNNGPPICLGCLGTNRREKDEAERAARLGEMTPARYAAQKRYLAMTRATPAWRDKEKIAEIYRECRRLSEETGIPHHVDHYYPIQGTYSCGLHVHQNLRIITAQENWSKNNRDPIWWGSENNFVLGLADGGAAW